VYGTPKGPSATHLTSGTQKEKTIDSPVPKFISWTVSNFKKRVESTILPSLYALPIYDFDLRASHARTLLPAAMASVTFRFEVVRVRIRVLDRELKLNYKVK